jgi:DNA ligase-associated metallophosphoesterase
MFLGFREERLELLPERALYLPDYKILAIADVHLGKATHFRKEGIMMPTVGAADDIALIEALCGRYDVTNVIFLGDLFHSGFNSEWYLLEEMLHRNRHLRFILTIGNHDILPKLIFEDAQILLATNFVVGDLLLSHQPLEQLPTATLNVAGHLHPGCLINGGARQQFRFPCFHYKNNQLLLPAFGKLTGLALMERDKSARVFPIIEGEVFEHKMAKYGL